ncbi:MAG: DcaP family trimeric outer membrane transporter [Pirellulaceae bacterium]
MTAPEAASIRRLPPVEEVRHAALIEEVEGVAAAQPQLIPPVQDPPQMLLDNVSRYFARQPTNAVQDMPPVELQREAPSRLLSGQGGDNSGPGVNLFSPPTDFQNALPIPNTNAFFKIGGYVKVDLIYDMDAIDSPDSFVTTDIPTSGPQRRNTRFHARQTRLNLDTRWETPKDTVRLFVEGDFFSDGDRFRLRHAYGQIGPWTAGQTWTTFTDTAVLPQTLDFEGSVASISLRRGLVRYEAPLWIEGLTWAASVEDPREILSLPPGVTGRDITETPDFLARVRHQSDWSLLQLAVVYRVLGFQPTGMSTITTDAWGMNFCTYIDPTQADRLSLQILYGEGIGSFRGLPDVAPISTTQADLLENFALTAGYTHNWTETLSSNFTYASSVIPNLPGQELSDLHSTQYMAINFIANPLERVYWGVEYLWGQRVDVSRATGAARRLQCSVFYDLP